MTVSIREARPEDAAGIAHVHVAVWRSTYRGIMPDALLDDLSVEQRTEWWRTVLSQPLSESFTLVGETEGGIVAFAGGGRAEGEPESTAELYTIYILQDYQGQGIGRAMMREAAARLTARGYARLVLWVASANPSRAFYDHLGGTPCGEKTETFYRVPVPLSRYCWEDLGRITAEEG
jgi:ribosomal protein S18 acetylase RimI-like enzyme